MNEPYYTLGTIWLNSLKKIMDEKINKVYIADVGLSEETKKIITNRWDKVHFLDTTTYSVPHRIHDNDWKNAVAEKTRKLLKICTEENYPVVMMDADQYIKEDFSDELYPDCDIQFCSVAEEDKPVNQDGYDLSFIGSWFVIHNDAGKSYVEKWNEKMWSISGRHVETPALCLTFEQYKDTLNYKLNHERVVSAAKYYDESKIIHFRSEGEQPVDLLRRIGNVENLPLDILENVLNYIRFEGQEKDKLGSVKGDQ